MHHSLLTLQSAAVEASLDFKFWWQPTRRRPQLKQLLQQALFNKPFFAPKRCYANNSRDHIITRLHKTLNHNSWTRCIQWEVGANTPGSTVLCTS